MSQISSVSSYDEAELDSAESDGSMSSLSRCSSSISILTAAVHTEQSPQNIEASTSLETGWTDSKHSSYLDFMEATFVKNMYGSCYCAEDVCGKSSCHHYQYVDVEEECDDSAQSQLQISHETSKFKVCDHNDWTWRPALRSTAPNGIPWVLLKNPWVKHFRPMNTSPTLSTVLISRKDEKRRVLSLPKPGPGSVDLQRVETHEVVSRRNPGVSNTKKHTLGSTGEQVSVTRQKLENEVKSVSISTNNQENASPANVLYCKAQPRQTL